MPMVRADRNDQVFRTANEKYKAIIDDIKDCYGRSQPVLVGTTSIENSELISGMLQKEKLPHQVLNAKQHAREAEIVAQAGRPKVVTIATNMAGRGTDIVLGGNVEKQVDLLQEKEDVEPADKETGIAKLRHEWQDLHNQVIAAGGLHIIGTERHEARRIDNQLRGRSGRQGDPGSSRFYLSLEDPLLRIFAGERVNAIMQRLGMPEGEPIEHGLVTRSIESAQRKVEAHNFDIRKQLLEYDNVANDQRREIYQLRNTILESQDVSDQIQSLREGVVTDLFRVHVPEESMEEQWDIPGLEKVVAAELRLELPLSKWLAADPNLDDEALLKRALEEANEAYGRKMGAYPPEGVHMVERHVLLSTLDNHWREHLAALDHLRQGIHLRGYAQKNPKQEYKREAFELFGSLVETVKLEVTRVLMTVELKVREQAEVEPPLQAPAVENVQFQHAGYEEALAGPEGDTATAAKAAPFVRHVGKIGRNDPCPCGSGKKYKHCHGKLA
jgi:preprotein translocase subunit SecA